MPVAPFPMEIRCPVCQWHTVWHPRSDALLPSDIPPDHCPKCGHQSLETRPASSLGGFIGTLVKVISGRR